jgi:Mn2+/Fe2+ NRAMP family transporter
MGTIAYIVGAEFDWRRGLSQKVTNAKKFYAIVGLSTLTGVGIAFAGVSPIRLLFVTSIAGGIATPISLVYLMLVASDRALMHGAQLAGPLRVGGWAVTALISAFALVYLVVQLVRR